MSSDITKLSGPIFLRGLTSLDKLLSIAAKHAADHKIEPSVLLASRLFPDMFPLARQVQAATDTAKRSTGRLAAIEPPSYDDNETTFEQMSTRIEKTKAFITGIKPEAFAGAGERKIEMKTGGAAITLTGQDYVVRFAVPNFYFHVTTAYNILRHNGVAVGKLDFLGSVASP